MIIHNSFQDFSLFLYLHVAHADGQIHQQEESLIREKIIILFGSETDTEQKFSAALDQYRSLAKAEITVLIKATFQHFREVQFAVKYKLFTDLFDIINCDGRVDYSETSLISQLRELMELAPDTQSQENQR